MCMKWASEETVVRSMVHNIRCYRWHRQVAHRELGAQMGTQAGGQGGATSECGGGSPKQRPAQRLLRDRSSMTASTHRANDFRKLRKTATYAHRSAKMAYTSASSGMPRDRTAAACAAKAAV